MIKCDLCDKPAVVHDVNVKSGVKSEVHLCEEHAVAAGIAIPGQPPINQLLSQFVVSKGSRRASAAKRACRSCGMTFAAFRQSGLLGCPSCYDAFERHLGPMIAQAQNGGVSHAGKCPVRGGASIDRRLRIQRLRKDLDDAVAAEQYERAAQLRDRLREIEPSLIPETRRGASPERRAPR